jgi:hypothetical protein
LSAGCEPIAHIIFYGIRFSDSHGDTMAKLEEYKVFAYKRTNDNYDYNEYVKKNTSDLNETKENVFIYEKTKPFAN